MTPVRFGYALGVERFERFRFSVPAVPLQKGVQERTVPVPVSVPGKTVPAVPVPLSVSGRTVPTVLVSGSGSVPEPPLLLACERLRGCACSIRCEIASDGWCLSYSKCS